MTESQTDIHLVLMLNINFLPIKWFQQTAEQQLFLYLLYYTISSGICSGRAGWGVVLQARKSWVWFSMRSLGFFIDLILPLHYDPQVNSDSNRNEYQRYLQEGKIDWGIVLTTFPPARPDCLENLGVSTSCSGIPRNFFPGWGGSTNSVEDTGQKEWGSGGSSPLVRGSAQFANEWNPDSY
jgi:hypothetical protein